MMQVKVPIKVSSGMFPSEYSAELKLANGDIVSFFIDEDLVIKEGDTFFLTATLVERDEQRRTNRVLLPREPIETATRWAEIEMVA